MSPTYYQIELSARMLTVLLVALALLLVLAFAFGYGAAWSVLRAGHEGPVRQAALGGETTPAATPATVRPDRPPVMTPTPATVIIPTPQRPQPTATRVPPTATPRPLVRPTTPVPTDTEQRYFWVQVLAVGSPAAVEKAQGTIEEAGYPRSLQRIVTSTVAGGGAQYKLRIGPLPDRAAANLALRRARDAGFPDAWIIQP
jgi:cell division septation protein DedD